LLLGELPPINAIDETWDRTATREVLGEVRGQLFAVARRAADNHGLWRALLARHARAELADTPLAGSIDDILAATWDGAAALEPSIPEQLTIGATITTRLAATTIALDAVLRSHGLDAAVSADLIYRIGWRIYARMGEWPELVAAAIAHDPVTRLRIATDLFRQFPFGAPAYQWRDVAAARDVVAFDCVRCPVAEVFAAHDASELCVATFCRLDVPLAEMWGGTLERSGTIASGAAYCDFRWHAKGSTGARGFVPVAHLRARMA